MTQDLAQLPSTAVEQLDVELWQQAIGFLFKYNKIVVGKQQLCAAGIAIVRAILQIRLNFSTRKKEKNGLM